MYDFTTCSRSKSFVSRCAWILSKTRGFALSGGEKRGPTNAKRRRPSHWNSLNCKSVANLPKSLLETLKIHQSLALMHASSTGMLFLCASSPLALAAAMVADLALEAAASASFLLRSFLASCVDACCLALSSEADLTACTLLAWSASALMRAAAASFSWTASLENDFSWCQFSIVSGSFPLGGWRTSSVVLEPHRTCTYIQGAMALAWGAPACTCGSAAWARVHQKN